MVKTSVSVLIMFIVVSSTFAIPSIYANGTGSNDTSYMPVPNPNPKVSTIQLYCSSGSCHTTPVTPVIKPTTGPKTLSYPVVEILLSQSCNTLLKNNIPSNCPTIKELSKFDTSNQAVSGKFVIGPNGDYSRTKPQIKNNWTFYTKPIACVECNVDLFRPDVIKTILIESGPFTYINKTQILNNTHSFISFSNQIIQGCTTATITYDPKLLHNVINYFESECQTKIILQGNKTNPTPDHEFNPKDSVQMKYNDYLSQVKKIALGNCIMFNCDIPSYENKFNN